MKHQEDVAIWLDQLPQFPRSVLCRAHSLYVKKSWLVFLLISLETECFCLSWMMDMSLVQRMSYCFSFSIHVLAGRMYLSKQKILHNSITDVHYPHIKFGAHRSLIRNALSFHSNNAKRRLRLIFPWFQFEWVIQIQIDSKQRGFHGPIFRVFILSSVKHGPLACRLAWSLPCYENSKRNHLS